MSRYVLCHHGVKGMHWGVRRYQNKDGSLTPAGRKKAHKLATKYTKVTGKNIKDHEKSGADLGHETRSRKIRKMSDEDLALRSQRLKNELSYMKDLDEYDKMSKKIDPPAPMPFSKRFSKSLMNDVITPSAKTVGKDAITKMGKKVMDKRIDDMFKNPDGYTEIYNKAKREADLAKQLAEKAKYDSQLRQYNKGAEYEGTVKNVKKPIKTVRLN